MWEEAKLDWLRQYIPLKNGILFYDTIGRLFASMDSTTFQTCFTRWVSTICASLVGQVVAIDGKTMRGSHHRLGKKAIHMVSDQGIPLGQLRTEEKTNAEHKYQALDAKPDETCEKNHGRIESRRVIALSSAHLEQVGAWAGLKSMTMVESPRQIGEKGTNERRFYISPRDPDSKQNGDAIRAHCGASKISYIGALTSHSKKMAAEFAPVMPLKTSTSSEKSP